MKVVLRHEGRWLRFGHPRKVLRAERFDEVLPALRAAENSGLHAAGFIAYEAAPAFDPALQTRDAGGFPLLYLGLFDAPEVLADIGMPQQGAFRIGELHPSVDEAEFLAAISGIRERIAAGETYQVNHTYRLKADFEGAAWDFFRALARSQATEHAAFVDCDDFAVCSASPELFFSLQDGTVISRPMKGTARRGRTPAEDRERARALHRSEKDRAENIMIVDMVRNDIGRVAEPGSVETTSRWDIEAYPTVWQMTSTVRGRLAETPPRPGAVDVLRAMFPCASITGAPKAKTMEIIRAIETTPRKVYTGSIGFIGPGGDACFNVAIRTALIDRESGMLEYGVGGGIVWDSEAGAEYEETLLKARLLTQL